MKNILILAALSAVILTGCGNISPPFKAEQTTVTTAAPTVSAAASSEAESTVDEEQVKYDTFIAEFFDSNICFADTSALVTEAMKGSSFENEIDNSNGVNKITLKGSNGGGMIDVLCIDLSQSDLDHDMEYILENFGDYYFGQTSAQMSGITEDDFVSSYQMTSSVVSKCKYQRYGSVQKSDGMASAVRLCSEIRRYGDSVRIHGNLRCAEREQAYRCVGCISQFRYDGKAEFFTADG